MNFMEMLDALQEVAQLIPHDAHVVIRDEDGTEYDIEGIDTDGAQVVIRA